jgi:magnesium chelatase family protein
MRAACRLAPTAEARLVALAERERLSGRGVDRLLRVSRTIADLAGAAAVDVAHLAEAARYRSPLSPAAALAV